MRVLGIDPLTLPPAALPSTPFDDAEGLGGFLTPPYRLLGSARTGHRGTGGGDSRCRAVQDLAVPIETEHQASGPEALRDLHRVPPGPHRAVDDHQPRTEVQDFEGFGQQDRNVDGVPPVRAVPAALWRRYAQALLPRTARQQQLFRYPDRGHPTTSRL